MIVVRRKRGKELGMMAQAYNPSIQEAKAGELRGQGVRGQPELPCLKNKTKQKQQTKPRNEHVFCQQ
jgi:hypothetical protein